MKVWCTVDDDVLMDYYSPQKLDTTKKVAIIVSIPQL